jgi:hypothetical protein
MGSAGGQFPSSHSATFGDPLRRVEEAFMKNLAFVAPTPPCILFNFITYVTMSLVCYHFVHCVPCIWILRSSSFLISLLSLHTYTLVPTYLFPRFLCLWVAGFNRFPPCIGCISDSLIVVVSFCIVLPVDTYRLACIQRTIVQEFEV